MKTAVFTIVSKNYLAFARTLLSSVYKQHPEWHQYLLLVDNMDEGLLTEKDNFSLVDINELDLPDKDKMIFRYTILELNTAVKPWMFYYLFNNKDYDKVIYLDPDIYVYDKFTEVEELLDKGNLMVLTPHLTGQLEDDKRPTELDIMRSGVYNLGFLAVSRHKGTNSFLKWWQNKLEYDCVVDLERGLFTDQKWIDLVPGIFEGVAILRHPGYNAAYWNIKHRNITKNKEFYYVNGEKLVFFHYSGINPLSPGEFSKHQDRYTLANIGDVQDIAKNYVNEVLNNGYERYKNYEYSFSRFSNNVKINDFCRKSYRNNDFLIELCGKNPFNAVDVFIYEPVNRHDLANGLPLLTCVMYEVWNSRFDLKNAFPDIIGNDRVAFCQWFVDSAQKECGFDEAFVNPIKDSIQNLMSISNKTKNENTVNEDFYVSKNKRFKIFCFKLIYKIGVKCKPLLKKVASRKLKDKLKVANGKIMKEAYSLVSAKENISKSENNFLCINDSLSKGINLVGYIRAETGVGESSRSAARAITSAELAFEVINFEVGNMAGQTDLTWKHKESEGFNYNVNLFHINADQMLVAKNHFKDENWHGRYNIGYWAWELPEFPDEWCNSFKVVNEVWAPSRFVVESVAEKSPVPVIRIPHCIQVNFNKNINRKHFGLPNNAFLFLSMYDVYSIQARKNPIGAIEAFKTSFKGNDNSVGLVVKVNNPKGNPDEVNQLKELIEGYTNIYLIERPLSREEVNALINITDSFVSLHRSEGFGLVLAEAMYAGKPVIGTGWSGNADFMNPDNSCFINYELVRLGKDYGPYKAHQFWAEPDIKHASYFMNKLTVDKDFYKHIAVNGQQTIFDEYSPEAVGNLIKRRLKYLELV